MQMRMLKGGDPVSSLVRVIAKNVAIKNSKLC
jgi:hypothetical protein